MDAEEKSVKICRVCLCSDMSKYVSLFESYKNSLIFDYINSIANVKIRENDGLPDKICPACLLDLETTINFKQKCESSNVILQNSVNQLTDSDTVVDIKHIVKKEEPEEDKTGYLEEYRDSNIFDCSQYSDEEQKPDYCVTILEEPGKKSRELRPECNECGGFFKSKCKLRVHWKKVHLQQALTCQNCKRIFKSYKAYHRHIKHKDKSCSIAGIVHIEGVGKSRMFHCKECIYKSRRIKDIATHLVIHSGDRPFRCEICSNTYTQQSSLEAHKEAAHKKYKVEITCQYCGKHIKGRSKGYRHLKTHAENKYQCDICKKMVKSKKILQLHMIRHTGVKTFTCEKCASSFYTAGELCNHKRMVHNKGKYWYNCDLCDYKAIRSESIKRHKAKHTDNSVPCTVCGRFFENDQKLTLHQLRHFEKKYSCPQCDKTFFRKDSVPKHMKAKHKYNMTVTLRPPAVKVKKENPVIINPPGDVIEIELSPMSVI